MQSQEELIKKELESSAKNYKPLPVVLSKGKGVWLWDTDGNKYLDMMSAYSAVSHGHAHPELVKVLHRQSELLGITSRAFYTKTFRYIRFRSCFANEYWSRSSRDCY